MRLVEGLRKLDENRCLWLVPAGWGQALGSFGGLILANMVACLPLDRPLRTLSVHFCGPVVPGEAEVTVKALRRGQGQSTLACQLLQGDEVQAHCVAVCGRQRDSDTDHRGLRPPTWPLWDELEPLPMPIGVVPEFTQHYEYRTREGAPFSGREAIAAGWVRRRQEAPVDVPEFMGYLDAWWPTILVPQRAPRPAATVSFSIQLLDHQPGPPPFFHAARLIEARDGYATEYREMWAADGRLLALNQQTFVVIK